MVPHHEIKLEEFIVEQLTGNSWLEGEHTHYSRQLVLYPEDASGWGSGGAW